MTRKLFLSIAVCFLFALCAKANVYTVDSNGNSGAGTLRDAIGNANLHNGTDTIRFNMNDTSVAGRTIILISALPSITGQLIIDGTSQNKGLAFGNSNTKILITASASIAQCFNVSADYSEIYGFFISNFQTGILVNNAYAQIGGNSKGNVLVNCSVTCIELQNTDHTAIVGNLIGVDTAGNIGNGLAGNGIEITNSYAITVGGHSAAAANVISGNNWGVKLDNSQYCSFNGNFIGTLGDGMTARPNAYGIKATGANSNMEIGGDSLFKRNIISGNTSSGIYGAFSFSTFEGNYIGTDVSGENALGNGDYGIYLREGSTDNIIGGETQYAPNIIAFNGQEAITFEASTCINNTVRRNSTFCNSQTLGNGGLNFNNGDDHLNPPQLTIANASGVSGLTYPLGTLDIYQDDTCTYCEGKTLITSITADANGVFLFSGALSGTITATVTDTSGNTSEYTTCTTTDNSTCIVTQFSTLPSGICSGTTINFLDQTITQPGSTLQSWQWTFGDGITSALQNPTHIYSNNGIDTITLITINNFNCSDTVTKIVSVTGGPVASFSTDTESCVGSIINFNDQSTAGYGASLTGWQWDFGDGVTANIQNPTHAFSSAGTFNITLTATNNSGCTNEFSQVINIITQPMAAFSFSQTGLQVTFTNSSVSSNHFSSSWNFGDGVLSNATNPSHIYSSFGSYNVCLSVYDSVCNATDSVCQMVSFTDGIKNVFENAVTLSPNPVNDVLTVSGISFSEITSLKIYDLLGREIQTEILPASSTQLKLNLQSLPQGVYILEMKGNDFVISRKISVVH